MKTVVRQPGLTELLPPSLAVTTGNYGSTGDRAVDAFDDAPHSSCLAQWCCCCCAQPRRRRPPPLDSQQQEGMPWLGNGKGNDVRGRSTISQDVYRKIKEVDNQSSTLTAAGAQGLSARVLEKIEYRQDLPDGTPEILVCQTIELIKKPAQSLGLFLREGNGCEQTTGVFVSRFGADSELRRHTDVIQAGDEIITVNNVNVGQMGIDDVVLVMSIPRRLVLRLRFLKHRRLPAWNSCANDGSPCPPHKPVAKVIARQPSNSNSTTPGDLSRTDSQESGIDQGQPTPTARTSLGLRARQQLEQLQHMQAADASTPTGPAPAQNTCGNPHSLGMAHPYCPRQYPIHSPRVLDGSGRPLPPANPVTHAAAGYLADNSVRRTESLRTHDCSSADEMGCGAYTARSRAPTSTASSVFSPRSVVSDSLADYQRSFCARDRSAVFANPSAYGGRGPPPPLPPKPALRKQPPSFASGNLPQTDFEQFAKSNSLPRRRAGAVGRSVKWRHDVSTGGVVETDSDGAISAPEYALSPTMTASYVPPRSRHRPGYAPSTGAPMTYRSGRTVDDIFSANEYQKWSAGGSIGNVPAAIHQRHSRWSDSFDADGGRQTASARQPRVTSLPPHGVLNQYDNYRAQQQMAVDYAAPVARGYGADQAAFDRLHISPLMNRRVRPSLQPLGDGWHVDDGARQSPPTTALSGLLVIQVLEGRGLKIPDRQREWTDELYCVVEVDGEHRARTSVTTNGQAYRWHESFEIDVADARQAEFFVYSWHPEFRHKLCHRGSLKLPEALLVDRLNGDRSFALSLEPCGQLLVRVYMLDMASAYRRMAAQRGAAYFGVELAAVVERECTGLDVPVVLRRLIEEIDRRGVDASGLYLICGSLEKKRDLRNQLEKRPMMADLSPDAVPDTNVLTAVLKDFLRELPEPIVPGCIFQMLVDAMAVCSSHDREGNARLILGVIDCTPRINKCTLMVLMDHFKTVVTQSTHTGLSVARLSALFGPLLLCSARRQAQMPADMASSAAAVGVPPRRHAVNYLDPRQAAATLGCLLDVWPVTPCTREALRRRSEGDWLAANSDSSGSENSTINLTNNGALSLLEIWLRENIRLPESTC